MVADEGRKSAKTQRMTGRARDGRLVHFAPGTASGIRPGDVVHTQLTAAAPHHLIADSGVLAHRRTRAGDAHEQSRTPTTAPVGVGLGLPGFGAPAAVPADAGCGSGCGS